MDNFPFLIFLFLFTAFAALAFAQYSKRRAQRALERDDSDKPKARMAVPPEERSPVGPLIRDKMKEDEAAAQA